MASESRILMVEDDEIDSRAMLRAFEKEKFDIDVVHVRGSEEALSYLEGPEKDDIGLVLLDLNMPGMNGVTFLKEVRERHSYIPVIVVTSSSSQNDIEQCYGLGADSYIQKPMKAGGYAHVVKTLKDFCRKLELLS